MIGISNADRDKAVEFIRAYAAKLQECGMRTTMQFNARRMALNLAEKLARKQTLPVASKPDKKQKQPKSDYPRNTHGCDNRNDNNER